MDVAASQRRLAALCAEAGLAWGERTTTYNSRRAQELAKWAETQPGGHAIHGALYRAYFVDGVNLARPDELVRIAEGIGLPGSEARAALDERRFAAAVDADWERSRSLGITGVPTYVAGSAAAVGAQPYEVLEQLVVRAGARPR